MRASIRLPFSFDPEKLKSDAARIRDEEWTPHFNRGVYEGEWDGVALRSTSGTTNKLYPEPNVKRCFNDTEIIARCPYFQQVLASFKCPLNAVRILRLRAGAQIHEHRDYDMGYEEGEVRIHVPIQTGSNVLFCVDRRLVAMEEGQTWYVDVSQPHAVENRGTTDRLHLILDCVMNEWLDNLLIAGDGEASLGEPVAVTETKSAAHSLDRFRELIWREDSLQTHLRDVTDHEEFVSLVVSIGKQCQFEFTAGDVTNAIQAGRFAWMERWIR